MARVFAKAGNKITFTDRGAKNVDITVNGERVELKRVKNPNNYVKRAREARDQGATKIFFEFEVESKRAHLTIAELRRKGFKGKYFFSGKNRVYDL